MMSPRRAAVSDLVRTASPATIVALQEAMAQLAVAKQKQALGASWPLITMHD